jgi:hypothetical protein
MKNTDNNYKIDFEVTEETEKKDVDNIVQDVLI